MDASEVARLEVALAGLKEQESRLRKFSIQPVEQSELTRISGVLPTEFLSFVSGESPEERSDFKTYPGVPFDRTFQSTK